MIVINCIGVGHWGPNLVRCFATHAQARVETVCDLSEERLALVRRNIPQISRTSSDPWATATDPQAEAIVIATPVSTHYPLARAALEAGKHVLVEKPLCSSVAQGEELTALAREKGKLLCVGHVFLFNNGVRAVRNLIRCGDLGRIHYIYSTRTNLGPFRSDVNALWDLAAHDLSILNYWLNADPLTVSAHGQSYLNPQVEDVVVASFTYPHRVLACLHASWLNPRKVREITVVGANKMVVWNDMDLNEPVRIYDKSVNIEREPIYSDSFGAFHMQVRNGEVTIPYLPGPEPLAAECNHFLDCIQGKCTPINHAAMGVSVLRALEAADRSMKNGSALVEVAEELVSHEAKREEGVGTAPRSGGVQALIQAA
ncbi:MAG: Gfo/Idh/MocA family oxidoreductase [Planctomycetes bacterium]|nr:Gfo/Idh/MocA family oxidoreductase [Planctomycetota bacterium]